MSRSHPAASSAVHAAALQQVRRRRSFFVHLLPYTLVVTLLGAINLLTGARHPWALWVAAGWGVGLAIHGLVVFGKDRFLGPDWQQRQADKLLARRG